MDHEETIALFSDYLDGELDDKQREQVQKHLDHCPTCRAELNAFRETISSLSGLHRIDAPQLFVSRVERTINRRSRGRFFGAEPLLSRLPFEWISFAIILALLALYLFVVLEQKQVQTLPSEQKSQPHAPQDR